MSPSGYTANLVWQCKVAGLPAPELEVAFAKPRRWRFDLAWPAHRLAVEVEGGIWIRGGGRHNRASSFEADTSKYNEAAILGWRLVRVTTGQVTTGAALTVVERALRAFTCESSIETSTASQATESATTGRSGPARTRAGASRINGAS